MFMFQYIVLGELKGTALYTGLLLALALALALHIERFVAFPNKTFYRQFNLYIN